MTDERAAALEKLDLSEVPAFTLTTLWGHLQDALADRKRYKTALVVARRDLLELAGNLDNINREIRSVLDITALGHEEESPC